MSAPTMTVWRAKNHVILHAVHSCTHAADGPMGKRRISQEQFTTAAKAGHLCRCVRRFRADHP